MKLWFYIQNLVLYSEPKIIHEKEGYVVRKDIIKQWSSYLMLQFIPMTLTLDSGVTRPPPLLSEADLMECMDKVRNVDYLLLLYTTS